MHGSIRWFAHNHVAANLLMLCIIGLGLYSIQFKMEVEVFPSFELDIVTVRTSYPGATPSEVEEAVTVKIEEALQSLSGIEKMTSRSVEGASSVVLELASGEDPQIFKEKVSDEIDAINSFAEEVEEPRVSLAERRREVISVAIAAKDASEKQLRNAAEDVRDELLALPDITQVDVTGKRDYELIIEVSEERLREYNLTLEGLAQTLRRSSVNGSAGNLRTLGGNILLQTRAQAYNALEYGNIVILRGQDGALIRLRDVATISDDFDEEQIITTYNNNPAIMLEIYRVGDQSAIEIAAIVREYVDNKALTLPANVEIAYWRDSSRIIRARLKTLITSAVQGGILVVLLLTLFLRPALAFWVTIGIPISFLGCFIILPYIGISINIVSLFAFIVVLGIVVDDAIVTGENVYSHLRRGDSGIEAAINGTQEVAIPVTFGVMTTVAAFVPIFFFEGARGAIFSQIPAVVIPVLLFSLIESKLVLPSHLKHLKARSTQDKPGLLGRIQARIADSLEAFIKNVYQPLLERCLKRRYMVIAIFISTILIASAVISSGWMRFVFFPRVQSETARASLTMAEGTAFDVTDTQILRIAKAAETLKKKYVDEQTGESVIKGILATSGSSGSSSASNRGRVIFEIVSPELRTIDISSSQLVREWRKLIGPIPGSESITYRAEIGRGGDPIDVQLAGNDLQQMKAVSEKVRERLATYNGLFDITDSYLGGKEEIEINLLPQAAWLGVQAQDLVSQVRFAFFGIDVQKIQRGRDEVTVVLRYPLQERRSIDDLLHLLVRTPDGSSVPFSKVAEVNITKGPAAILRTNRKRTLNITADANKETTDLTSIKRDMTEYMSEILPQYPGVTVSLEGEAKEQRDSFKTLGLGVIGVFFMIFALLAIPLRSYAQPLVVMSVIPFGLIGAILGHWMMGMSLTIISAMGMLALIGVVVNDSLVLVDYINKQRVKTAKADANIDEAVLEAVKTAGGSRFRPVFLTSATTFIGLMPLLFEDSTQAQFLKPMAVSLGFGIVYATLITLIMVPCNYLIGRDIKRAFTFVKNWVFDLYRVT